MASTAGGSEGVTTGVTDATLVGSPAASTQRIIRSLSVYNADTVAATVTIKHDKAATERIVAKVTLQADETFFLSDHLIVLDATDEKLEIVLAAAVTTNELQFVASYLDDS